MKRALSRYRWVWGCCGLLGSLLLERPELLMLWGALALPAVLGASSGRRALSSRLRALGPVLAVLLVAYALTALLTSSPASSPHAEAAPFALNSSWVASHAVLIALRVLAAAAWLTWLTHDLRAGQLEAALCSAGFPEGFVTLLMMTRRFGQQLRATLEAAWAAGALRGGLLSLRSLRFTLGAVAGVVVVRSLDRSERVAVASALRGGELQREP